MLSIFSRSSLLLVFSAILISAAFAQTPVKKPVLRGRVVDPNHAGIPGADIWASGNGLPSSTAVTNQNGEFSLALEPGEYQVRVLAEGFSETTETVSLMANSQPLEIVLPVAASNAIVTITDAYGVTTINSATKTLTPLRDIPQSISVVTKEQIREQSRPTRHPRQQHERRFLSQWRARRRSVLPRSLQRRARRGIERTKLNDV